MYTIRNFPVYSSEKNTQNIIFTKDTNFYIITIDQFPHFNQEDFLFTLKETLQAYHPSIQQQETIYVIKIAKEEAHSMGEIFKDFYSAVYKNWCYY